MSLSVEGNKAVQEFKIKCVNIYVANTRCNWALHIVQANIMAVSANLLLASNSELIVGTFWVQHPIPDGGEFFWDTWISDMLHFSVPILSSNPPVKELRDYGDLTLLTLITW